MQVAVTVLTDRSHGVVVCDLVEVVADGGGPDSAALAHRMRS
jgi:hypothetical protein